MAASAGKLPPTRCGASQTFEAKSAAAEAAAPRLAIAAVPNPAALPAASFAAPSSAAPLLSSEAWGQKR